MQTAALDETLPFELLRQNGETVSDLLGFIVAQQRIENGEFEMYRTLLDIDLREHFFFTEREERKRTVQFNAPANLRLAAVHATRFRAKGLAARFRRKHENRCNGSRCGRAIEHIVYCQSCCHENLLLKIGYRN